MASAAGAFGKIPSMGDFLRVNLSAGFVQAWDSWLQAALLSARETLGAAWNEKYLSAPIWRFSLPAGQAGPSAVSGVLMASVDRVGRQYPLTLAIPHKDVGPAHVLFSNGEAFSQLEDAALAALEDDTGRDDLMALLDAVSLNAAPPSDVATTRYAGAIPAEAALAALTLSRSHPGKAVWSTVMPGDHRMMVCPALPNHMELTAAFDLSAAFWTQTSMVPMT